MKMDLKKRMKLETHQEIHTKMRIQTQIQMRAKMEKKNRTIRKKQWRRKCKQKCIKRMQIKCIKSDFQRDNQKGFNSKAADRNGNTNTSANLNYARIQLQL